MRSLLAVYKREAALLFRSIVAYAIGFALLMFIGLLFASNIAFIAQQQAFGGPGAPATDLAVNNLSVFAFLMFLIAPLLTMRLLAEEAREGTLEVLMTLPMSDWAFVAGKFLAVWTYYSFLLLLTGVHLLILSGMGPLNPGWLFALYLGAWLYGGATLAISMIWSAVTEDQIVAAFLGAATVLVLFLADQLAVLVGSQQIVAGFANFLRELGLTSHYQATMMNGIIRAQDVIYFVFMIAVCLFITTLIVGTRRWRA